VQLLIHQLKIPSQIELFTYAPDNLQGAGSMLSLENPSISFKRLGHFSLDDNVKTNYQARELKTVYVDAHCQYLKLILHKNHVNHVNIFN
jgi:centrosomal protein CEP104